MLPIVSNTTLNNTSLKSQDAVQVQTSQSKDDVGSRTQNSIRRMANFKDVQVPVRRFRAATPYQRPVILDNRVNDESEKGTKSALREVDMTSFAKSLEETTKRPNVTRPTYSYTLPVGRNTGNPKPWSPVPFPKPSKRPGLITNVRQEYSDSKTEDFKGEEYHDPNNVSVTKAAITTDGKPSPTELNAERKTDVLEMEGYISRLRRLHTSISKEAVPENESTGISKEAVSENRSTVISKEAVSENKSMVISKEAVSETKSTAISKEAVSENKSTAISKEAVPVNESRGISKEAVSETKSTVFSKEAVSENKSDGKLSSAEFNAERKTDVLDLEGYRSRLRRLRSDIFKEAVSENESTAISKEAVPVNESTGISKEAVSENKSMVISKEAVSENKSTGISKEAVSEKKSMGNSKRALSEKKSMVISKEAVSENKSTGISKEAVSENKSLVISKEAVSENKSTGISKEAISENKSTGISKEEVSETKSTVIGKEAVSENKTDGKLPPTELNADWKADVLEMEGYRSRLRRLHTAINQEAVSENKSTVISKEAVSEIKSTVISKEAVSEIKSRIFSKGAVSENKTDGKLSPTQSNADWKADVLEIEGYRSRLRRLRTAINQDIEAISERKTMDDDPKVAQAVSEQKEEDPDEEVKEERDNTGSPRKSDDSASDTDTYESDVSSSDSEQHDKLAMTTSYHQNALVQDDMKQRDKLTIFSCILNIFLWFWWCLKQYLFFAFLMIRYFF